MLRFFWPTKLSKIPSVLTRFGRVLHWIAALAALPIFLFGLFGIGMGLFQWVTGYWERAAFPMSIGLGWVAGSLVLYFAGRALRYIFSGE